MIHDDSARCRSCGSIRPLAELLAVRPAARPELVSYLCRPSVASCFGRSIERRDVERIALADPAASASPGRQREQRRTARLIDFNAERSRTRPRDEGWR